jgi:hypothetical protein
MPLTQHTETIEVPYQASESLQEEMLQTQVSNYL